MKLIEKNTNRIAIVRMYHVDYCGALKSIDVANDFFDSTGELVVDDLDYCIDQVKDWVDGSGEFADEDDFGDRMAEINDELYVNYDI